MALNRNEASRERNQTARQRTDTTARESAAKPDETEPHRPSGSRQGLGWARKRDIQDTASQQAAPRRGGTYDQTGEEGYAEGLEEFEEEGGAQSEAAAETTEGEWELDEGGVQFGGRNKRRANATPDDGVAINERTPARRR